MIRSSRARGVLLALTALVFVVIALGSLVQPHFMARGLAGILGGPMDMPDRIAAVLAPHLGAQSADAVSRHICAKYGLNEHATAEQLQQLDEFLRRGLVAYVGAEAARTLAAECVRRAGGAEDGPGGHG